jgi:predicted phosphodiesterase
MAGPISFNQYRNATGSCKRSLTSKVRNCWGLIADVHGNLAALEQALGVLKAAGAARLAFLGDYLGRGDSDACVRRIREVAEVAIVGNRDLDWQDRVAPETRAWVLSLPRSALVGELLVAHGDVRLTRALSTAQIGRHFAEAWQHLSDQHARVLAFGHSHHARTWRKESAAAVPELLGVDRVDMERDSKYFVNVGTTGLPFPGKGPPSVAIIDFSTSQIKHVHLQ